MSANQKLNPYKEELGDGAWNVYYRHVLLGWIDEKITKRKKHIFESLSTLESISSEDDFWKDFLRHPNVAKTITKITSSGLNLNTRQFKQQVKLKI